MSLNGSSEKDILNRLFSGQNEGLVEELLALFGNKLYGFCSNLLADDSSAEKILSSAIDRALGLINEAVETNIGVSSLLYRSVVEEISIQEQQTSEAALSATITKDNLKLVSSEMSDQGSDKHTLKIAVQALPYEYRVVYLLHETMQVEVVEITKILGISEIEVKAYLHRARLMVIRYLRMKNSPILNSNLAAQAMIAETGQKDQKALN